MERTAIGVSLIMALVAGTALAAAAATGPRCEAGKNDAAGKYAACTAKAQKNFVLTGDTTKYADAVARCEEKLVSAWDKLEAVALASGGVCSTTQDQAQIQGFVDYCVQGVAEALEPLGTLPSCYSLLDACKSDLAACTSDCSASVRPPLRTGQTICYNSVGTEISCLGTGQDGELQKGAARSFTDNGDGTITDNVTGLTWEKQSNDGTIHDYYNRYNWNDAFAVKVATLNSDAFVARTDWRVPNARELETLLDYSWYPAVYDEFIGPCDAGCTVLNCSCTAGVYWSSTTVAINPAYAVNVFFGTAPTVGEWTKSELAAVRAVRGGS